MLLLVWRTVCVSVFFLGWKIGAGTTNTFALSFTPWGVAIVTPQLQRQTARLLSLLTSAHRNCKLHFFFLHCRLVPL